MIIGGIWTLTRDGVSVVGIRNSRAETSGYTTKEVVR